MPAVKPATRFARQYGIVVAMVLLVTIMHYVTEIHVHAAHGIYRRLYYFPIIVAAFRGGWRAGLATSIFVCVLYIPHAFGGIGYDPGPALEKGLEVVLYIAVGLVCGILVTRLNRVLDTLSATAARLQQALAEKSAMEGELIKGARLAAVGRLSAGLAHEIRNPLASIEGVAEIISDDFPDDHPKRDLLGVLRGETKRLNGVLTRFLEFARPHSQYRATIDLAEEVAQVVNLMRHQADISEISGPVPDSTSWELDANREQIKQLFINLIRNASEAAGPGGRVIVSVERVRGKYHCAVEDDGPGFTEDALENFATPFFTTKESGTGLGIAISHRIVEDHGGRMFASRSRLGGARIEIELPDGNAGTAPLLEANGAGTKED